MDGGIVNNLPVDVVRGMGAEIVIAVALHVPLPERKQQYSLFGVFDRTLDIMLSGTELRSLAAAEVAIIPDLRTLASGDFSRAKEFIAQGYSAAAAKANLLKRFALPEDEWAAYQKARQANRRRDIFEPDFVITEGLTAPLEKNLTYRLAGALAPPAGVQPLDEELTRLAGLGRYDAASYRIVEKDGKQGLVRCKRKRTARRFSILRF